MDESRTLPDPRTGTVLFLCNNRAKRYIIRIRAEGVRVTIPRGGSYRSAEQFFHQHREEIIRKQAALKQSPAPGVSIEQLRRQAKQVLPQTLARLAKDHGFRYKGVTIRKSRTRWGSCSARAMINLSLYLMLLPPHLIEYVLLHELCHTVHLNHSPAFWALLDKHTNGKAAALRRELRAAAAATAQP